LFGREGNFALMKEGMRDLDEKWDVMKLLVGFVLQDPSSCPMILFQLIN
jgi:hypothetical protein